MRKAVLVIAVLFVLVVAAWWIGFRSQQSPLQPPAVPPAYSGIAETWKSKGLPEEFYHANFEALVTLPAANLEEMKGKFVQLKNGSADASDQSLFSAYSDLTGFAVETQKLRDLEYEIDAMEGDVCSNAPLLQQYLEQLKKTETAFEQFSNSSNSFAQKYRQQAEAIQFFEVGYSYLQQIENLKQHYLEMESVVRLCA